MQGSEAGDQVTVSIRVLGPLQVEINAERVDLRRIEARLLIALMWNPNTWLDHDLLSQYVYFDGEPRDTTSWRNHLRRALGPAASLFETRRGKGSRLNTHADDMTVFFDVDDFHTLHREGEEYLRSGEHDHALRCFRKAEGCWRGATPFVEVADDVERHAGIVALQARRWHCRQTSARLAINSGDFAAALPDLRSMAEDDPTDQATIAHLMRAAAAVGNPTLAGEQYDRLCHLLSNRGEIPTAEVIDLHGRILRDELAGREPSRERIGADLTTFVGREVEMASAHAALSTSRLVTLVGPPGVGKSRLAREIARDRSTPASVWFVQLASCPDGSDVAVRSYLADELDLSHHSGVGFLDELASRLSSKSSVLVLDNCEHVIETLIVILAGLFSRNEAITVLATSHQPVGIPGEAVLRLAPLSLDFREGSAPATSLCLDRVHSCGGGVEDESALEAICRELEGMPLAIELVAPEIAVAGPIVTLERLQGGYLPMTAAQSSDPRHSSLHAAVGWSVARLDDAERQAVFAAATFRGGVDAADIAALTDLDVQEASDILMSLATKSLLRPTVEHGQFVLFELVRRFARFEAHRAGQSAALEAAHARWASSLSISADFPSSRRLIEAGQALHWAIGASVEEGIEVIDTLRHDLYRLELPAGLSNWLYALRDREGRLGPIATELWATCAFLKGSYAGLDRHVQDTLRRVEGLNEPHRLTRLYVITAFSFASSGNYPNAAKHAAMAEHLAQEVSDPWAFAWAASIDAYQYRRRRLFDDARRRAHEALDRFDGMNYPQGRAFPMFTLAMAAYREHGDQVAGLDLLAVGIQHAIAGSDQLMEATGELFRAQVFAELGDAAMASGALIRSLESLSLSPHWNLISSCLEYSAVLLAARGDEETAMQLTSVAAHARWRTQVKSRSRAIPYLPARAAEPLLALPARPDPKFMTTDPMDVTLQKAIRALRPLAHA